MIPRANDYNFDRIAFYRRIEAKLCKYTGSNALHMLLFYHQLIVRQTGNASIAYEKFKIAIILFDDSFFVVYFCDKHVNGVLSGRPWHFGDPSLFLSLEAQIMSIQRTMLAMGLSAMTATGALATTVGQWTFDETSGDTFLDSSGSNRNLTATNPQPLGSGWHRDTDQPAVAPLGGRSLNADSPRVIESASSDVFSLGKTDQLTIEFWYKDTPQASQVVDYILNNNSTGNNRYAVFLDGGDRINFFFIDKNGGTHFLTTGADSITEAAGWQHIAGVFDTTAGGGAATLYINGSIVASSNSFGDATLWDPLSANLRVMTQQGAGSGFDGNNLIDELRISNVALPSGSGTGINELAWNASLVPEPTSGAFLAAGIAISGLLRRRRSS